jgi:cytoskeleton protein RodZ
MKVRKPWPEDDRRYRFLFLSLGVVIAAGILVLALFLYDQADRAPSPPVQDAAVPAQVAPVPLPEAAVAPAPAPAGTGASAVSPATEALPPPGKAPAPDPASREVPVVVAMPPAPAAGKQYHLVIEARELTWLRITEDRNPPYQVLLKQGDRIERMASDHFQLDIGNAGGIQLVFQGKPLGVLGKQGQIIHMRLPEKGVERKP